MNRIRGLFQQQYASRRWHWRNWTHTFRWTVAIVIVLSLVIGGLVAGIGYLERRTCHSKVEALNRDSRWGYFSGCLVEDGGRWVPLDNWRRNEQSEDNE